MEAILGYGFEQALGVEGPLNTWPRWSSETLAAEPVYEPDPNIDPTGDEAKGEVLRFNGGGTVTSAPDSESWLKARVQHHGYYEQSTPATGVRDYELRREEVGVDTPPAHYIDSLNFGVWRDERDNPTVHRLMGGKVNVFTASVDANKYVNYSQSLIFTRDSYMDQPEEVAVDAAWTGSWRSRGHREGGDENGDEYNFKVVTQGAVGVAEIVFGKNGVYGTTEYLVVDDWMDVRNVDDTLAGLFFQIRPIPGGVLTVDDEFKIDPVSAKPVPVQSTRPKLNGNNLIIEIGLGGVTLDRIIETFELTMTEPVEGKFGLTSPFAQDVDLQSGDARRSWGISFDAAQYVDLRLRQALISGRPLTAYTKFSGAPIGSTGLYDFAEFTLPNLVITNAGATITGPGRPKEPVQMRAFAAAGDVTMTEKYRNTILSIAPA